jgi:hypothetical protein
MCLVLAKNRASVTLTEAFLLLTVLLDEGSSLKIGLSTSIHIPFTIHDQWKVTEIYRWHKSFSVQLLKRLTFGMETGNTTTEISNITGSLKQHYATHTSMGYEYEDPLKLSDPAFTKLSVLQ